MLNHSLRLALALGAVLAMSHPASARQYNAPYTGEAMEHVAYPIGGLGSGMFCFEGTGAISHMSVRHFPDLFNEPCSFAAIHVKGLENGTKVLQTAVPSYKIYGREKGGKGVGGNTWGLPRFEEGVFESSFPFAKLSLKDRDLPLDVQITAWNPFIPDDEDNSGLPVASIEYTFHNTSGSPVDAIFSYNTRNFMFRTTDDHSYVSEMENGFILCQDATEKNPEYEGYFAIFTDDPNTVTDCFWFKGGWFDPLTMTWNKVASGDLTPEKPGPRTPGASLFVPFRVEAGGSHTVRLMMAWYVPKSDLKSGEDTTDDNERGVRYDAGLYEDYPETYEPWYSRRFSGIREVADYWASHYCMLKTETERFNRAFYDTTLPDEVIEAVSANLTILKSSTVMRQHDGRLWLWEGCGDREGSCPGSCKHVWNYAQAIPHLFPRMEKTLRDTEYKVDQTRDGNQVFRSGLPIRPVKHIKPVAADGQFGGIMKVYRDWHINGDTEWVRDLYPLMKESLDYAIRTWDPKEKGTLEEPHHNTYDIEFWGPDGMCSCFYGSGLNAFIQLSKELGVKHKDYKRYEELLEKNCKFMSDSLWNGQFYIQKVRWTDLVTPDPTLEANFSKKFTPEAQAIIRKEGPKYQYGNGCISDGVLGYWMSMVCGINPPADKEKMDRHLESVYKYNLKHSLMDHACTQRPGYASGDEGGLLLCTWPEGGKPSLPFVYSDEVWTGIEYQVASHLIFEGKVEEGLDIVRTCRDRYNSGRRNPYNEYECGSWYGRALASYGLLQALTGVRYDALERTLYIDSRIGDFRSFLSVSGGYATVGLENGEPFVIIRSGAIRIDRCIVSGKEKEFTLSIG